VACDFGISEPFEGTDSTEITRSAGISGTAPFMDPKVEI